ncbi:Sec63-domain-containing protein [Delitschia confertaspora ATCC 74209]|uniref:Sec63-domain-containing protein n=1 Tax=Delitschia confertaspora ATCC 74209 TaxID=1513339 RepID=A0A9P4JQL6_9PLEO|nr:Sec63-domain-containing protein [Delitschia confertaspora ATCC 74209]
MLPSLDNAQSKWLTQLAEMRQAIAELNLPTANDQTPAYGDDLDLDDDDLSGTVSGDDIWDLISDEYEEEEYSSDHLAEVDDVFGNLRYDQSWLAAKCFQVAQSGSGLDGTALKEQIMAILASDSNDEELQMMLADMVGYGELDLVADLIAHRRDITRSTNGSGPGEKNGVLGRLQTRQEREEALRRQDYEHKHAALGPKLNRESPHYPHVYRTHEAGNKVSAYGKKYALPPGSTHLDHPTYEEHTIPAAAVGTLGAGRKLIEIKDMDGLCRRTFKGYQSLNRMQSLVYPVAYSTSENMLICAPTGAGKTDAAMLTILNTIAKNIIPNPIEQPDATDFTLLAEDFKIIYVAPMKALAAEITEKLGKRLSWLGVQVRELTGDMHLTKAEIVQTQIIVTTPEKWDVVTRKSTGDTELVQKVRLLIIDEVHMLHDERGAVLESLVARTQRQVESTQSLIRIVGLSATLPNYVDVADFLRVNKMAGLFYFDASFRPVPLEQHFVGVKGKPGSAKSRENLDFVAFEKVADMLRLGHQVMVFVHSRKDTFKTARTLYEKAMERQCADLFDPTSHPRYDMAARDMKQSKGKELRELLPKGMGTHHAGMPRSDRNIVERLFAEGVIKVLCCTATLAWGVNLPAAAVVIKGTQVYNAQEGRFTDLGILDVLQIFGRAGRPQFQDTGIGFICTTHDKLDHYLKAVTEQQPIESRFSSKLVDNLNAEISLGTVTTVSEAVQWLGYSYLFVRMQKNPLTYGIEWQEIRDDPMLVQRRRKLIIDAARILQTSQMIIFNETTEDLRAKDVGRIASQYYVQQSSIEIFNSLMAPRSTEADVLGMISMSGEFDNVQSRDTEEKELSRLQENGFVPCEPKGGLGTPHGKTNVLLQSYISRARLEDYTLVSDTNYITQNATRICRALFMIALNRRWGYQCLVLLNLCQSIERQLWVYQHPLHQFDLPHPILRQLDEKNPSIENLRDMEVAEIGQLVHNNKMGNVISKLLDNFPTLTIDAEIAPLNRDVLRIRLYLTPDFRWNDRHHGTSESYWIWVENSETSEIYHHEFFILSRKKLYDDHELNFTIPLSDPLPSQIYVRAVSDRWLGAETVHPISFQHLIRPDTESVYTDLLNLQPLPISALKNPILEEVYAQRFQYFNPMQTQIFHCLYHTPANVLLGSPTGSGKTVAAELAMWWAFREKPGSKVVYIAPMKALVRERVQDWGKRLAGPMGLRLVELTGDNTPDTRTIRDADIIITTPEKWDGISRSWQTRGYVRQVSLVIIDEIHLLGGDRGPILEIIVSRMNYIASQNKGSVRLLGMSTACANATDLGNWLGVREGLFNFRHSVRPVPLEIFIDGFPEQRGFCPLMQSMNRPTFLAIKAHSPEKPVIVFVASRRQTRLTARDLINLCGMEDNPRRFLHMSEEDLSLNLSRVRDEALREALSFGIGLHHAGLVESDRQLSEELFANNKIQILVATSTLAWGVNLPAHLVVVKGTQFFDAKIEGYKDMDLTDVLQMLGRAGRPQFDSSGIARIFTQDSKKEFYKHFLHTGFPVESTLHKVLDNHLGAEISAGTIATKQDALDYLTWTFFFRRLHKNPSYYGLEISAEEHNTISAQTQANEYMVELVETSLKELADSSCADVLPTGEVDSTALGKIMSYYYLSHKTIRYLVKHAKAEATFADVLSWTSHATEYDELPVRHNEDLINVELSNNLPLKADTFDLPMWDPHVKAFLLLQAHFSRIDLPITDYVGDLNSVLDQSIRIVQASIDVMTELGYLSSCEMLVTLLQCIKSARWPTDGPLSILPGVDTEKEKNRIEHPKASPKSLVEATSLSTQVLEKAARFAGVPPSMTQQCLWPIPHLPKITVSLPDVNAASITIQLSRLNPVLMDQGAFGRSTPSNAALASGQSTRALNNSRDAIRGRGGRRTAGNKKSKSLDKGVRIYAPRYPKPQTEGFFVVVSFYGRDEIIALKRVGWQDEGGAGGSSRLQARTRITFPAELGVRKVDILVLSDGYVGMKWKLEGVEIPEPPKVDMDSKKEKI